MKDIDHTILEALRQDDEELYRHFAAEHTMFHNALDLFRGRLRWLAISLAVTMVVMVAISVYFVIRFFRAEAVKEMLFWLGVFMVCVAGGIGLKIWAWIEMSKNSIMRELKRIELQVAYLANEVRGSAGQEQT